MSLDKLKAWKPIPSPLKPVADPSAPPRRSKADAELATRVQALEAKATKLRNRAIFQTLRDEAAALGITGKRVGVLVNHLVTSLGERIEIAADDTVTIKDDVNQPKAVKDYLASFLKTDDGEMFRPAVQTAGGPGLKGNGDGNGAPKTAHDWSGKSYKEIMEAARKDPAAFKAYANTNREEFEAKKRE